MSSSVTLFQVNPRVRSREILGDSSYGLPPSLLAEGRDRLRRLSLLLAVFAALDTVVVAAVVVSGGRSPTAAERLELALCLGSLAFFGGLWAAARSRRFRHSTVLNLGLLAEVITCFAVSVINLETVFPGSGILAQNTWVVGFIIAFPLIVPSPPLRALLTALLAATMAPLGLMVTTAFGVTQAEPLHFLWSFISPAFAVVIASFGSHVVYGLHQERARALQLGSYHLESRIGRGGMGEVWRASHSMLARPAAVKLIRPDLRRDDPRAAATVLERFEREAQATAALRSSHSIVLHDYGVAGDGTFYYVMELLDGLDLETLVEHYGPLPAARVVFILEQVCHSLADAHAHGLIHRDIKPANVFLCRQGLDFDFVKVLDFGLVGLLAPPEGADPNLTAQGGVQGTPAYLPPEMATGGTIGPRTDLYALGCLAFWLLTGRLVFEASTPMAAVLAHAKEKPMPPSAVGELAIPAELDALVLRCLAKAPADRPADVASLADELRAVPLVRGWSNDEARAWWHMHHPA